VGTGYLAPEGFTDELRDELGEHGVRFDLRDRLFLTDAAPVPCAWVQNVWLDTEEIAFDSIAGAVRKLRAIQRNWVLFPTGHHRRAQLIAGQLPPVRGRLLCFGDPAPTAPLGSFTLIDRGLMIAAPCCSSPFPHGEPRFVEDTEGPPSRAYLKLWEIFLRIGRQPRPGERCIDLGSSPGGWTWVLASLGTHVLSIDKAALDPRVLTMPGVQFERRSAFAVDPAATGKVDWLFSDVICYPSRLLSLVERFLDAGTVDNLVCTLKFQGRTDHGVTKAFAVIPGSTIVHLHHNRHELTWVRLAEAGGSGTTT
jgi:23S rRNA (cytidine2498-2'-O)-methyltransferase